MRLAAGRFRSIAPAAWLAALLVTDLASAQAPAGDAERRPIPGAEAPASESARDRDRAEGNPPARAPSRPSEPPIDSDSERPVPDYDGQDDPTTVGDVLIWVPRIVLSPLYLVSEYVVRRPLGWVTTTAEREKIPAMLVDFFTFGPKSNAGIVPTFLIDFGFRPSVGLYFFYNEFLAENNKLRARAATWGPDWLMFNLANRTEIYPGHEISLRGEFLRRPDWIFHGFGPESQEDNLGRFSSTRIDADVRYDAALWRSSSLHTFVGFRTVNFDSATGCCADSTVEERIAEARYPEPTGIDDGYTVLRHGVDLALDTRKRRHLEGDQQASDFVSPPGSGVRLDLRGLHAASLVRSRPLSNAPPIRYEWLRYGATLGGFVDVTGEQRVLGLSLVADFADPLRDELDVAGVTPIPFTEQVSLGGERPMRGFLHGRLVDRSAAVAVLEYQWPIWVWLDGALNYSVGNVFAEHLENFELRRLRNSIGIGFRSNGTRDHPFELLVAVGTKTFDEGSGIDYVRLVFGTTSGF